MESIITLYDIMGIQNFIFSTNKLKENLGSSLIVEEILRDHLRNIIKKSCSDPLDLNKQQEEQLDLVNNNHEAIIVYIAGGNALIIYKDEDSMRKVNNELSRIILTETGGILSLAVAYLPTKFENFYGDYEELERKIKKNKQEFLRTRPMLGLGITKEELSTGLPAQDIIENEAISHISQNKREKSINDDYRAKYLSPDDSNSYKFPLKIENLGQVRGSDYIAIVHIDGNDMGQRRKSILRKKCEDCIENGKPSQSCGSCGGTGWITPTYSEALRKMNEFSLIITQLFETTIREMIKKLIETSQNENHDEFRRNIKKISEKDGTIILPIRPLILKGDDITFICHGKLGLGLVEEFFFILDNLQNDKKNQLEGKPLNISASAGVLIINSKFPFHRAYEFSEELCRSAKIVGKAIENQEESIKPEFLIFTKGFWLDFHICQSEIDNNLEETRKNQYNITGSVADDLKLVDPLGNVILKQKRHNLLWRPWCLRGCNSNNNHNWNDLLSITNNFKNKKWAKNKIINFKKSFYNTKESVYIAREQLVAAAIESEPRLNFPSFKNSTEIWRDDITPYYDALEIIDYYIKLEKGKEGKGEIDNDN